MNIDTNKEYFDWLCNLVCGERYSKEISFNRLLTTLHETEFTYTIPMDANRASNGVALRRRYDLEHGESNIADECTEPCSVLEMMIALALRCEETIMLDPAVGDRTGQWFWGMITNLGLGSMHDVIYNDEYVKKVITTFLKREYESNGKGGLFTVKHCDLDMRNVEIWVQMCRYLEPLLQL